MSYYSELDLMLKETHEDNSYPSFETQLMLRYEDLIEKYHELVNADAPKTGDRYYSGDDYRYAPIGCFETIRDICRAIEITKEDWESICDIVIRDDGSFESKKGEVDPAQISICEILLTPVLNLLSDVA